MKNLLILLCISIVSLGFFSCSTGDGTDQLVVIPERIEGSWDLVEFSINDGVMTTTTNGIDVEERFTIVGLDYEGYITFTPHPYNYNSQGSFVCEMSFESNRETIIADENLSVFFGHGDWDVNGDRLTKHLEGGNSIDFTITDFSDEFMKVTYLLDLHETIDGATVVKQGRVDYTLKKRT